jgi:adenosylmethionine-8-amino-7-oxononanoate aminotransferase
VALKNIEIFENERILEHVRELEPYFEAQMNSLRDLPIVGDVRGAGFFWGVELVKDQGTRETFAGEPAERLLRGYVSPELFRRGLICRSDDRGDPVVQVSPPLICDKPEIDFLVSTLREVLAEAPSHQ